jgi:hypothetical protein
MRLPAQNLTMLLLPPHMILSVVGGMVVGAGLDVFSAVFPYYFPYLPLLLTVVCLAMYALLCLRAGMRAGDDKAVLRTAYCGVCYGMRLAGLGLFFFMLVLILSGGQGATRLLSAQMEQQRILMAADQQAAMTGFRGKLPDKLVENPQAPRDYFNNALLYQYAMGKPRMAFDLLDAMYRQEAVNKIDAAMLYVDSGRAALGEEAFKAALAARAQQSGDLMLRAMQAQFAGPAEKQALRESIRKDDPRNPMGYWDIMEAADVLKMPVPGTISEAQALQNLVGDIMTYRKLMHNVRSKQYFFLPQYSRSYFDAAGVVYRDAYAKMQRYWRARRRIR